MIMLCLVTVLLLVMRRWGYLLKGGMLDGKVTPEVFASTDLRMENIFQYQKYLAGYINVYVMVVSLLLLLCV